MRLRLTLLLPVFWLPASAGTAADEPPPRKEIREDFDSKAYDRQLWTLRQVGAQVDLQNQQLRLRVPRGRAGRPPIEMEGGFRIEGDFDIKVDYSLTSFPRPAAEWINVEIFVEGPVDTETEEAGSVAPPVGSAAVIRTHHSKEGSGYSLWHEPAPGSQAEGAWKQIPTSDTSGILRLTRTGKTLRFLVAPSADKEFRQVGIVEYGTGPVAKLSFRLVVPETTSSVEIGLDNVAITADRIEVPPVETSMLGPVAWGGIAAVMLVVICAIVWHQFIQPR